MRKQITPSAFVIHTDVIFLTVLPFALCFFLCIWSPRSVFYVFLSGREHVQHVQEKHLLFGILSISFSSSINNYVRSEMSTTAQERLKMGTFLTESFPHWHCSHPGRLLRDSNLLCIVSTKQLYKLSVSEVAFIFWRTKIVGNSEGCAQWKAQLGNLQRTEMHKIINGNLLNN